MGELDTYDPEDDGLDGCGCVNYLLGVVCGY